ncbi:hypothetical protein [Herbaspirillum huttiense]|uniref:hypothetical protein n=1 Tax=Herbaspirillum huttiense TaxID=863372 RepID=UPI0031D831D3
MALTKGIEEFVALQNQEFEEAKNHLQQAAKDRLLEVLDEDISLIESIALDADVGKFLEIKAPQEIIERLRAADLVRE